MDRMIAMSKVMSTSVDDKESDGKSDKYEYE